MRAVAAAAAVPKLVNGRKESEEEEIDDDEETALRDDAQDEIDDDEENAIASRLGGGGSVTAKSGQTYSPLSYNQGKILFCFYFSRWVRNSVVDPRG